MLNRSELVSNSLQPHGLCSLPGSSVHKNFQATILDVLSFPTPGDLPNQWTEHSSLASPAPIGGFFFLPLRHLEAHKCAYLGSNNAAKCNGGI